MTGTNDRPLHHPGRRVPLFQVGGLKAFQDRRDRVLPAYAFPPITNHPLSGNTIDTPNSKTKGDLIEAKIIHELTARGCHVSSPFGDNATYDLVVEDPDGTSIASSAKRPGRVPPGSSASPPTPRPPSTANITRPRTMGRSTRSWSVTHRTSRSSGPTSTRRPNRRWTSAMAPPSTTPRSLGARLRAGRGDPAEPGLNGPTYMVPPRQGRGIGCERSTLGLAPEGSQRCASLGKP